MSWKSLVIIGLLCVLASPAFAAPTLALTKGGTFASGNLDVNGNWVWKVQITPDQALVPDASGTPVAAELGFTSTNRDLISATRNATDFDTINPGNVIFGGWQTAGNGLIDAGSNNRPTGLQLSGPAVGTNAGASYTANSSVNGSANQVFAALGSVNITSGTKDFITITVKGPSTTGSALASSIQVSGAYGGNGRIAQISGGTAPNYTTANYDTFGGASYLFTKTAHAGDANLDGNVDGIDLSIISASFGSVSGKHWYEADFNTDGAVDGLDLASISSNFGFVGPPPGAGAGGLEGAGVPEPASAALLCLAALGGLGVIRRKRS